MLSWAKHLLINWRKASWISCIKKNFLSSLIYIFGQQNNICEICYILIWFDAFPVLWVSFYFLHLHCSSWLGLQNTPTASLQREKTSSTSILFLPIALENIWDSHFYQGCYRFVKCKQYRPGFELRVPNSFPTRVIITLLVPPAFLYW